MPLLLLIGCVPWSDTDLDGDGISARDGDCDDTDSAIYPGARDFRGDGIDDNCDGVDGTDRDGDGRASLQEPFDQTLPGVGPAARHS